MVDIYPHPTLSDQELDTLDAQIASITEMDEHSRMFTPILWEGEPPPREWIVEGYIPKGCVTGLFGPGGVGKSLLLQQLCTSLGMALAWLGLPTQKQTVLSYFCEDDKAELWRRQTAINKAMGIEMNELGNVFMQARPGLPNLMMTYDRGVGSQTEFFEQVERDIGMFKATVVLLDNSAQLFGGNENDRREVTQFVNALHKIVNVHNVTIVLLGHPPKPSANGQAEYSGSTAWDACFRSRLYFGRAESDEDDEEHTEERILRKSKANYSSIGDTITVEWKEGVFWHKNRVTDAVDRIRLNNQQKQAKEAFLQMLDILTEQHRETSHAKNSSNYAPKLMMNMSIAMDRKISKKLLEKAMQLLLDEGVILANQQIGVKGYRTYFGLKRKVAVPIREE